MIIFNSRQSLALSVLFIAAFYQFADTVSVRVNTIQLVLYVVFFLFSSLFVFLDIADRGFKIKSRYLYFYLFLFLYIILIPIYFSSNEFYLNYFSADLISFLMILIFVYIAEPLGSYIEMRQLKILFFLLVLGFVFGVTLCIDCSSRYEPVHFLAFTILFALFYFYDGKKSFKRLFFYFVLYFVLLGLVFISGERTTVVLALLLFMFYLMLKSRVIFFVFLLLASFSILSLDIEAFDLKRFETLFSGDADQSILSRLNEVYDVVHHFSNNASLFNYLLGFGFSATYEPVSFSGVDLNVTPSGTVHHVHVFPFLIFLRFGLLGVVLYLYLWWKVLKDLIALSVKNQQRYNAIYIFSLLSAFLFLLESLMRSVFVDPFFYIVLSLYIYYSMNNQLKKEIRG
jgi:hypothetical protein